MKKIMISILITCAILVLATGNMEGQSPVGNNPPNAPIITGPTSVVIGKEYNYTFNATDADGDNVYYYIKWGDGSPDEEWIGPYASGEEITLGHTWYIPLTYTIKARARDSRGDTGPWGYLVVAVTWPKGVKDPTASFSWSSQGASVVFTDASVKGSGEITSWHWEFGDGSSSTEKNPDHGYSGYGNYNVSLQVGDENGKTNSVQTRVSIEEGGSNDGQS